MYGHVTTCHRCGQAIKNIYTYRGKSYGPECIKVVTGRPVECWVVNRVEAGLVIDEAATAERDAEQALATGRAREKEVEQAAKEASLKERCAWIVRELRQVRRTRFVASMLREWDELMWAGEEPREWFSPRQLEVMADIIGGQYTVVDYDYESATAKFWALVGEE